MQYKQVIGETIMKHLMKNIRYIFALTLALLTWSDAWAGGGTKIKSLLDGSSTGSNSSGTTYGFYVNALVSTGGGGKVYIPASYNQEVVSSIADGDWKTTYGSQGIKISCNSSGRAMAGVYAKEDDGYRFLGFGGYDGTSPYNGVDVSDQRASVLYQNAVAKVGNGKPQFGTGTWSETLKCYYGGMYTSQSQPQKSTYRTAFPYFCYATFGVPKINGYEISQLMEALDAAGVTYTVVDNSANPELKTEIHIYTTDPAFTINQNINAQIQKAFDENDFYNPEITGTHHDITIGSFKYDLSANPALRGGTNNAAINIKITSANHHGDQSAALLIVSKYNGTHTLGDSEVATAKADATYGAQTFTVYLHVDLAPSFDAITDAVYMGSSPVGNGISKLLSDFATNFNTTAGLATWSATFSGLDASDFSCASNGTVTFTPSHAGSHSATMTLRATYTDAGGQAVYAEQTYTLTGDGAAGVDPITISATDATLTEGVSAVAGGFAFPDLLGTNQGVYVFDVENATSSVVSFSGESASAFSYTYDADTKKLTIYVQSEAEPVVETPYSVTMTISGGGSPAMVNLSGRFMPKAVNNLAFISPLVVYTNTTGLVPVTGGNGEPITITLSSTDFLTTDGSTLSGKAVSTAATHVTVTQPASATMQGVTIETDVDVIRHTSQVTLTPGFVVYTKETYLAFVATDNSEAAFTASITAGEASIAGNNLTTQDESTLTLHIEQAATTNYEALNTDVEVYVVKNPAHVMLTMSQGLFDNSVMQNLGGEDRETLLSPFTIDNTNVVWTGSEWNGSAYTGATWTSGKGNTNQFTLKAEGASVTYHFAGVPDVMTFSVALRYPGTTTGRVIVEESADNSSWTTMATYTEATSGISLTLNPNTRYIRFSSPSTSTEFYSIQGLKITEGNYVRLISHYYDYTQQADGSYADQQLAFSAANWGSLSVVSSSPDFTASLSGEVGESGVDQSTDGILTIRHTGAGNSAWIKIMQGGEVRDYVRVTAIPRYIEAGAADIVYTGTDLRMDADDATITGRQRTFENTFATDGTPLFDNLYVFGVTRNIDDLMTTENGVQYPSIVSATGLLGSNAKIPCYIYTKNSGRYELSKTIENMNVTEKDAAFNLTASGQKLYFTGTCGYATTGWAATDEGALYVKGASGSKVDLFFENCSITSRHKTKNGHIGNSSNVGTSSSQFDASCSGGFTSGSGAALVLQCTDNNTTGFLPNIHLRGKNTLNGMSGIPTTSAGGYQVMSGNIDFKVTSLSQKTTLTFDDIWPTSGTELEHTNGSLTLSNGWSQPMHMRINLGNEKGTVIFNGGYYSFSPVYMPKNSTMTLNIYQAIGYYKWYGQEYYGVGETMSGGTVIINDGTFYAPAAPSTSSASGPKLPCYENQLKQIRSVENTIINGGSFLVPVVACQKSDCNNDIYPGQMIVNKHGDNLIEQTISASDADIKGLVSITMPDVIEQYYSDKSDAEGYGQHSIRAAENGQVTAMLPAEPLGLEDERGYAIHPWVYAVPRMNAQVKLPVGSANVQVSGENNYASNGEMDRTHHLVYVEVDENTRTQVPLYEMPQDGQFTGSLSIPNTAENYSSIVTTNGGDYEVRKTLTMMLPIVADHWYIFTAPFDINTVSVMEIRNESKYEAIASDEDRSVNEALVEQAADNVSWFAYLAQNVFHGSVEIPFMGTYEIHSNPFSFRELWSQYRKLSSTNAQASLEELSAFSGPTDWDANYFLYEPSVDGTNRSNYWTLTNGNLDVNWIPAQPEIENEQTYVMRRGRTYAMQFPYCPGCKVAADAQKIAYEEEWDYWTGKYLVLEGVGPQTIWGSSSLSTNMLTPFNTANQAAFRGNASFGKTTVTNGNVFYHNEVEDEFRDYFLQTQSSYVAKPGQGYLLVNGAGGSAPERSYPFQTPSSGATVNTATGIPTIGQSEWRSLNPTGEQATKVLIDGQLYIIRDGRIFDAQGREVVADW